MTESLRLPLLRSGHQMTAENNTEISMSYSDLTRTYKVSQYASLSMGAHSRFFTLFMYITA